MAKVLIETKGLTKKYNELFAVNNIDLKIHENEKIAIIGANGAGKSTLVDMIGGIRTPSSGEIKYYFDNPKGKIGLQIQDTTFPDGLRLSDIIKFYCNVFKKKMKSKEIQDLIIFFQLEDLVNRECSKMSGGQRQRVNAMLTLINKPKILIIDEMSTGLDITTKLKLIEFINKYVEENDITYVTISHSESEIIQTANRIIIMEDGKIIKDTTAKAIGGEKGVYQYFKNKVL